ncbi:hypothetical protein GS429_14575 [Natronorubrum sp. JWXQ-INN-674]|uniref:DUF7310 domain-containing protein n=1 Tax=Natronorubrum halalkaliphilum TaxID=2691917 RepID=A0A6B0VP60_9EURY|nr:hypothetical protein [Natronorubrum halalkaliphilum]MXV63268.1 hypothetical protein [Natronorubrum halalkaliphilum]
MSDIERIDQRLAAVERAVVDGDAELDRLADLATLAEDVEHLEDRLDEHERRLAELAGTVDAIGGLVGNVETVNEGVERQADAAIAAVDRLENRIDELERSLAKGPVADGRVVGDATSARTEMEISAANSTGVGDQTDGSGHASGTSTNDSTGPVATTAGADTPFEEPGDIEATAEALLDPPGHGGRAEVDCGTVADTGDGTNADVSDTTEASNADEAASGGLTIQRAIERRVAGSDDAVADRQPTDNGESNDQDPSTDADDDSGTLLASLRTRLP